MFERTRALLALRRALRLYDRKRYEAALEAAVHARGAFGLLHEDAGQRRRIGETFHLEADIREELGDVPGMLKAYEEAEQQLSTDSINKEHHGRVLHDIAITLERLGMPDRIVQDYIERSQAALEGRRHYAVDLQRMLEQITPSKPREPTSPKRLSRQTISEEYAAVTMLVQSRDSARVQQGLERLANLVRYLVRGEELVLVATALGALRFVTERTDVEVPPSLIDDVRGALQSVAGSGDISTRIALGEGAAIVEFKAGRADIALIHALTAVALDDARTVSLDSSSLRDLIGRSAASTRHLALSLAIQAERHALAAELIESARLQAVPLRGTTPGSHSENMLGELITIGEHRLGPVHPVAVAGESAVLAHYVDVLQVASPVSLDEVIEVVGGPDAWWWGTWIGVEGRVFWAVRDACGHYSSGWNKFDLDDESGAVIRAGLESTPHNPHAGYIDLVRGPLTASVETERDLSTQIGSLLLPECLRREIALRAARRRSGNDDPISLVVSGNALSLFPVPLLGVGGTQIEEPLRLIEGAVLRFSPPAALTATLASVPPNAAGRYPVALACFNPTGDLAHATYAIRPGSRLLTFDGDQSDNGSEATVDNLLAELRHIGSGSSATFFYSGHASSGVLGADLDSGFVLRDGILSAEAMFASSPTEQTIVFPVRALLSACGSSGAAGAGRDEWLGLAAACLVNGARQVIATAWPIWDLPFTAKFDEALLTRVEEDDDVASGLRHVQLSCLEQWRGSDHDLTSEELPRLPADLSVPLVWAAYQFVGMLH